ncbi:hypothetical protein B7P43_G06973 [Cryptotermes secundus]|uniref:Ionotropic glutamate receptor L-glutamate and glycine-binding domain-containing protein n=2 Tax=Cryptotermes secundus TaxID=105785 RepID=A0A2J7R502_9NEOP|nr:hypothetical protein B7P43_G06973 [Cryptotermes secundus]
MWVILLVLLITPISALPFASDMVGRVTVGVLDRYQSTCVYLIHTTHQQVTSRHSDVLQMKAIVAARPTTVAVIFANSHIRTLREEGCRPLRLIISDNGKAGLQKYLRQESTINDMSEGRWLLFLDKVTSLEEYFSDVDIPLSCEFVVAQLSDKTNDRDFMVSLTEVFYVHPSRPLQTHRIGNWSSGDGFMWSTKPFVDRRGDLQGVTIQSGVHSKELPKEIERCKERTALKFCGEIGEIWHILQEILNFTSAYYVAEDGVFGAKRADGTWNGVMNLTISKKVEVGIGMFILTEERVPAVYFLPPILNSRMSVHMQEPRTDGYTWSYMLAPFSYGMRWTVFASVLVLTAFLSTTWYFGDRFGNSPEVENYSLCNSWITVLASFFQQGHATTPRSWSCRLVFFTSYLTAVTLLVAYSATFISFLAVRKTALPFADFEGMLNDGTYRLGLFPNSAQMNYLQNSPDAILRGVFEKLVKPGYDSLPTNDVDGLRRICGNWNYAFLISPFFVRQSYGYYHCTLVEVPGASLHTSVSIIMNKKSNYKRLFTRR